MGAATDLSDQARGLETRIRVTAIGLFVDAGCVLVLHQMTGSEPNCWDLPGGGVDPGESLEEALRREVWEETGIREFRIKRLLGISERFYSKGERKQHHALHIMYDCELDQRPTELTCSDPEEVGPKGIQWISLTELTSDQCSTRCWEALQAAGWV